MHWSKYFFILPSTSPKEFIHWMILFHIIGVTKLLVVGEPRWVREPAIGTAPRAQLLQVAPNKIISYQSLERQRHRCEMFLGTSCIIFGGLKARRRRRQQLSQHAAATLDARRRCCCCYAAAATLLLCIEEKKQNKLLRSHD